MKFFFQCILIFFSIIIIVFYYNKYFKPDKTLNIKSKSDTIIKENKFDIMQSDYKIINDEDHLKKKNNLIKNLKYEIKLSNDIKYIIDLNFSEIFYENLTEMILMKNVKAKYIDQKNLSTTISADEAIFNTSNNNTYFKKNIIIKNLDNLIFSNKLDLDFNENNILIYGDVVFKSPQGLIKTDNIKIDLFTKNILLFMNDTNDQVQLISDK